MPLLALLACTAKAPDDTAPLPGDTADSADTTDTVASGPSALHLGIPAYIYPGPEWTTLAGQAGPVGLVIANPASGPGATTDANYASAIAALRAAGIQVIGYVPTGYGERPPTEVSADIQAWRTLYTVDGVFFDEAPGTASCAKYEDHYAGWASDVRAPDPGALVVLNPGTDTCQSYLDFADVLMTFDGAASAYDAWSPPTWAADVDPSRFWNAVYGASAPDAVLAAAQERGVGWIYVTDDVLPNPWDTLPPYWADEVEQVAQTAP